MPLHDPRDHPREAGGLLACELPVFAVHIVNQLGNRAQRLVAFQAESRQQRLERAAVALVRVIALEHVEGDGALARGTKDEARLRIDEASTSQALAMRSTCTSGRVT